jgi:hypothetical protein
MKAIMYVLSITLLTAILSGCLTLKGVAKAQMKQSRNGQIIMPHLQDFEGPDSMQKACALIDDKDARCAEKEKFQAVSGCSKVGYADGCLGAVAVAPAGMDLGESCVTGSTKCTYLLVQIEPKKLATVLGVVSRPGDNKCKWSGWPRIGGVVCTQPAWDYHTDNQAAVYFRE